MIVDSKTKHNVMSLSLMNFLFGDVATNTTVHQRRVNPYRTITPLNQRQRRKIARQSGRPVCPK